MRNNVFVTKLKLPYNTAIPLLSIYPIYPKRIESRIWKI